MIRVKIERDAAGVIRSYSVKGHADYAKRGKDIVCAGVSAVTVGTVNSIEKLTGTRLEVIMKSGLLQASVPVEVESDKLGNVQLLLESMVTMLRTIQETYGEYITIQEN
jgi:uncharacterized protein YsxB (DUF464 family)